MDQDKVELQSVFRIWPGYDGAFLEVCEDGDGMIRVKTTTTKSEEYFGKTDFSIEPRVAAKLAEALKALT